MKLNLEINNIAQSPVKDEFFVSVAEKTFGELKNFLKDKNISISIALVAPEEIQKLNKEYRECDSVTDVLSFPEYASPDEIRAQKGGEIFLGELILCYDDVKEYADKENIKLEQELANVVSHGILHLLGFSHGEEMFGIQKKIKSNF